MEREVWTIKTLKSLGYKSDQCMTECKCDELPCPLISWLVSELRNVCPEITGDGGTVLAGELKEILNVTFYPYDALNSETLTPIHLKRITEFLVSELQAAHLVRYKESCPENIEPLSETCKEQRQTDSNAHTEEKPEPEEDKDDKDGKEMMKELEELFRTLDMGPTSQLSDAYSQVESRLASLEAEVGEPLLKTNLSSSQWSKLQQINRALRKDYDNRRQMMIKRFYVTLQSFTWGERGKDRSALLSKIPPFSVHLESCVSIALLLAAREDQSCILPVTAGPSTAIHKVLMGSVPDRGGRPGEIEPPMPIFTRRSEGGGGQRREKNRFKKREYSGKKKKNKKKDES
ncbi:protein FAM98B [Trichomycterus rosablanca]|uniref:protein FAM98B n=1 Tax=Trichomycterus rosablanca TaxID=2290929 RepID=UPI002F3552B7